MGRPEGLPQITEAKELSNRACKHVTAVSVSIEPQTLDTVELIAQLKTDPSAPDAFAV
jgi:hypothetical protein